MRFNRKMYICDELSRKKTRLKWELRFGLKKLDFYIISLANGTDMLEIFKANMFKQKYFRKIPCHIVGIAKTYDQAVVLVQTMLKDSYAANQNYNVKEYFLK